MHPNIRRGLVMFAIACTACTTADESTRIVGQLESDRVELVAEFAEPIVERLVAEGEAVSAGQIILRLDDGRARARMIEFQAGLEQHRARLDELTRGPRAEQIVAEQANVAGARRDLDFRRIEYERALKVHERQLASPESLDRAQAALDSAQATLEFHEARLDELLSGTTVEELRQAQSAVDQAEARLAMARIDLERHEIVAPVDGIVDSLPFETGERPTQGLPVAVMLAGTQPFARTYVPEPMRTDVAVGDTANVYVDGIDTPFTGRVRWIANDAAFTPYFALTEHDRGRLSFFAKIDIVDATRRLPDGVPVEVEFAPVDE